ncbi:restriction endonuclease subunit S [Phascolarctobacterium succinatutens]|uniref:restriction endonuclease subunit S n=1 Tax=Phascolarctobacterium succinatutens TaxID=626940 RepID=UPI0026956495|nr:restriction endonuclease subunit S [Phascolarctobacterium succinatutens]
MPKKKTALTIEERLQQALVPAEEQPYEVPENWVWVRLGEVNKYMSKSVNPISEPDKTFELYSVPSMADNYPEIIVGSDIGSSKQSVCKGDVLLCKINPRINRVWKVSQFTDNELIASSEWIIIRNNHIDANYLMYCFQSKYFREFMLSNVSGVGGSLMRAQPKYVQTYPIPLPPLSEQQRIVERIEELFAKLDEAKERLQEAADSFAVRKAAILHKAFTGELTKQWRLENGVSDESWEEKKLGEVGSWLGGGTPSTRREEYWENGNILWITSKDMKSAVIEDTLMKVNEIGVKNSSANYIEKPALLVVMRSGILRRTFPVAMVKKPFTVNQDLKAIIPDKDDLEFLFWMLLSNERRILDSCMKNGTTVESINSNALKAFAFKCPTLPEQHEIVRLIDDLLARERSAQQATEQALASIDLMKKSILARAFRGELGTNKASEASALELLRQVLAEN